MAEHFRNLYNLRDEIEGWIRRFGLLPNQAATLDDTARQQLNQYAKNLCAFFEPRGFTCALRAARRLQEQRNTLTPAEVSKSFRDLWDDFLSDCDGRLVELIEPANTKYYDQDAGFGYEVAQRFPSAKPEIRECGTCYALGRHTASVFHAMRAVEHGLRALTGAVGVVSPKVPLNYQDWNCLIQQVESRSEAAVDTWGKSAEVTNARQFFHRLVADLYLFKDDVRNVTMHTRASYDAPGALSVRNRAAEWFAVLATRVSENTTDSILEKRLFTPVP